MTADDPAPTQPDLDKAWLSFDFVLAISRLAAVKQITVFALG